MKKILAVIISAITMLCVFCSCENTKPSEQNGIKIVCTAFPQYDFAKNILGNAEGTVTLLTDNGADLHSYEPTAADIVEISSADLFIYIGGVSDEWVSGIIKSANNPSLKTLAIMDSIDVLYDETAIDLEHNHEHEHERDIQKDEHIWLSLSNAVKITEAVCKKMCEADSGNSSVYTANADAYIEKINALDKEYRSVINSAKRNVLLFADRFPFRYLTESYSLEYYAAFSGCSSESEASFETVAFLIDKTKKLSLPVILTIDGSDGSLAKTVSDATGAKIKTLDSCQSVSAKDIENGTDYLKIMASNLEVLKEALN